MSDPQILALNAGSSSLKFALYSARDGARIMRGKFERLGESDVSFIREGEDHSHRQSLESMRHAGAIDHLLEELSAKRDARIVGMGHRIVHGGARYSQPTRLDDHVLDDLRGLIALAPEHLPTEIAIIEACRKRSPEMVQVACFDTGFHRRMPLVARQLPIPRRFAEQGVERYGFHGLSYEFVLSEIRRQAGDAAANSRMVLAHLGNGASLAAVSGGQSVDTTMGFTPAAGVPMSTRSGDLDPGLVRYLAQTAGMDAHAFDDMVNHRSGLIGISGTSSDIRDLLATEVTDPRAAEAIAMFCYHIRKAIGAFAAALGGLDLLAFTGGIGENSPAIRSRICEGLTFLGVELDADLNNQSAHIVSSGRAEVRVIPTDEEAVIAAAVRAFINKEPN